MRIKKLEWSITKGFMSERWYARAMGIDWTIPVSSGTAQDNKRVEAEKEKAQDEFERNLQRWIEDGDLFTSPKSDENNSADNFYLCVLEKMFGKYSDDIWRDVLAGDRTPPWPLEHVMKDMGLVAKSEVTKLEMQLRARTFTPIHDAQPAPPSMILNADDKGTVTLIGPTAKDRVVDRLIQEHKQLSEDHRVAAGKGQVGLTEQQRARLKSIETALAIAVKDGDIVQDKPKEG